MKNFLTTALTRMSLFAAVCVVSCCQAEEIERAKINDKSLYDMFIEDMNKSSSQVFNNKFESLYLAAMDEDVALTQSEGDSKLKYQFIVNDEKRNRIRRNVESVNIPEIPALSSWGSWSSCNVTLCGSTGTQQRVRRCMVSGITTHNQQMCQAALMQIRRCEIPCTGSGQQHIDTDVNSSWDEWSNWNTCSATCGKGTQSRMRNCLSDSTSLCIGASVETGPCLISLICPYWDDWSGWSSCSKTCGNDGARYRIRSCLGSRLLSVDFSGVSANEMLKQTSLQNIGDFLEVINSTRCPGDMNEDVEPCIEEETCQAYWTSWTVWSSCSVSCGMGFASSTRDCLGATESSCFGNSSKYRRCFSPPCWSTWSDFTQCNASCGNLSGVKHRTRHCSGTNEALQQYRNCEGENNQTVACNTELCPLWGAWTRFSRCSLSCNGGTRTRTRRCLRGICRGRNTNVASCNYQPCPYWSTWSSYSCCSVTCGDNGVKVRKRTCRYGFGRRDSCPGDDRQRNSCSMHPCNTTLPSVFDSFQCGLRNVRDSTKNTESVLRIFGGRASDAHGWPWQSSWQHRACFYCDWIHFCGATLVAPQWVLTASHCTEESAYRVNHDDPGETWSVILGMHRLYEDGERYFVRRVFVHPDYEYEAVTEADIALLKLRRPAQISADVTPVCLPQMTMPIPGETCYITGWGYTAPPTTNNAELSIELLEARIPIVRFEDCQNLGRHYREYLNRRDHMCAGDPITAAKDSCTGDSGGPLVCRRGENQWYLAGVTSFGFTECGVRGHVGIYAPLNTFELWVRDTIENHSRDSC